MDGNKLSLRETDILAYDFYPSWLSECPMPTVEMSKAKWQADKHVAHITEARRGVNQPGTGRESVWQIGVAIDEIGKTMTMFLERAPSNNFDPTELRLMLERVSSCRSGLRVRGDTTLVANSGPQLIGASLPLSNTDLRTIPINRFFGQQETTE